MFIALEGIDGAGKGTICGWLAQTHGFRHVRFPSGLIPTIEEALTGQRELRPETLTLLFLAEMLEENLNNAAAERYYFSTLVYEGELWGMAHVRRIVESLPLRRPDAVILLDVEPEVGLRRKGKSARSLFERVDFLSRVRRRYLELADEQYHTRWFVVDANQSLDKVKADVISILRTLDQNNVLQ